MRGATPRLKSGAEAGRTPMPEGRRPRGATPHSRSGAAAESARLQQRRNGREELPKSEVRGGGREDPMPEGRQPRGVTQRRPRVPGCDGAGTAEKSYPSPRSGEASERRYPVNEVSGGSREELPYARGQGRQPGGPTPCPRSSGCAGGHRRA